MKQNLLILFFCTVIAFITWKGVFYGSRYIASKLMGYKTSMCRYGVDTELIPIARERYHKQYYHEPLTPDPVFDRNMIIYEGVAMITIMVIGLTGCVVIWLSKRNGKMLRSPVKWVWVCLSLYLLRTPLLVGLSFTKERMGIKFCWPDDPMYIGHFGLNPYIFSPILCVLLLACLASALYKAVWVTLQQHRFY